MTKPAGYIVAYTDSLGMCLPMGKDKHCEGAICIAGDDPVLLFPDRAAARRAIRISTAYARLCEAQGKPVNTDFTYGAQGVRILPLEAAK